MVKRVPTGDVTDWGDQPKTTLVAATLFRPTRCSDAGVSPTGHHEEAAHGSFTDKLTETGARERVARKTYVRATVAGRGFDGVYSKYRSSPGWRTF